MKIIKRRAQNVIEVVLIIPLLLVIIFGIVEYALFQRNVHVVQDIALEAAVVASKKVVTENLLPTDPNPAVDSAIALVQKRLGALGLPGITFTDNDLGEGFGTRPFALYELNSNQTIEVSGEIKPMVTVTVDYRDPYQEGVSTQVIYYYNMILFGAEFSIPGGRTVTIIPRNIQISSTQTQQYVHY